MNTDMLKWLWIEIERFRVDSEDPSSEPVTIDMLQTIVERVADTYGVDARQTPDVPTSHYYDGLRRLRP